MTEFGSNRLDLIARLEPWHFWFVGRRALVTHLLDRWLPAGVVLEIGCGTGWMAEHVLTSPGTWIAALDRRPEGLARVRAARPQAPLIRGDAERLPLASACVDGVVALDVLEHTDDGAVLSEVARVLRPGGVMVLTVPALPWLWSARDVAAGHRRRYTRRRLRAALQGAGLDVVHMRGYQRLLLPLIVLTRVTGKVAPRAVTAEERPAGLTNRLLTAINLLDVAIGHVLPWPAGSSLAAVCRKP